MQKALYAVVIAFFLVVCVACTLLESVRFTQVTLLDKQQKVLKTTSEFAGAKDIVAQKITAAFNLADRQISHEDRAYKALADARKQFDAALATGVEPNIATAAQGFNLQFRALAESNPAFASGPVVQAALNATEESVNEIFTKFQDQQSAVADYNKYRSSLYLPALLGSVLNFPPSYDYYKGSGEPFEIKKLIPEPPKAP